MNNQNCDCDFIDHLEPNLQVVCELFSSGWPLHVLQAITIFSRIKPWHFESNSKPPGFFLFLFNLANCIDSLMLNISSL